MAAKSKKGARYAALRPHATRVIRLGEYPLHVNGAYLDDPERIPMLDRQANAKDRA